MPGMRVLTVGRLLIIVALAATSIAGLSPATATSNNFSRRQDTTALLFPTPTSATPATAPTTAPSRTTGLAIWSSPIPMAAHMGLIVPGYKAIINVGYTLGFLEDGLRPAPVADYSVHVLPQAGTLDPGHAGAYAEQGDQLCSAPLVYPGSISGGYKFSRLGWHMFVVNETWAKATISDNTCQTPLLEVRSFFATQVVSVGPAPTIGTPQPPAPNTIWAPVTTTKPGRLPVDSNRKQERVVPGVAIGIGIGGLLVLVFGMWYIRHRRKIAHERAAFANLRKRDQLAFLAENPDSRLNPDRKRKSWKAWGRGPRFQQASDLPPLPPKDERFLPVQRTPPVLGYVAPPVLPQLQHQPYGHPQWSAVVPP